MRAGFAVRTLAAAGAAAVLSAGAVVPAAGATSPSWQVVQNIGTASAPWTSSFYVSSPGSAWSTWTAQSDGSVTAEIVERWTGTTWTQVQVPASLTKQAAASVALGASSAKNAWLIDPPATNSTFTRVLRWNGTKWVLWAIPVWALVWNESDIYRITPVFFSSSNVWLFSLGPGRHPSPTEPGPYVSHYNGRKWSMVPLPGIPNQVSAVSPNDIWAFGVAGHVTSKNSAYALMHWNGHRWLTVQVPKAQLPGQTYLQNPVALGPNNVWVDVDNSSGEPYVKTLYLLHWNGRSWSHVSIPAQISHVDSMTQDGHGGLWLAANGPPPANTCYFAHLSDGRWTTAAMPPDPGYTAGDLTGITWIPGTLSVWATGGYSASGNYAGAILKYGP